MCRLIDRSSPCRSLAPSPAVTDLNRENLLTCMTEFGYKHQTENHSVCAKCLYQRLSHKRNEYEFAVRHYIQICRERIIPECYICAENLGIPRPLSECEQCSEILPAFLEHLAQSGGSLDNLDEWFRIFIDATRRPPDSIISQRLAAFSISLRNANQTPPS